MLQNLVWLQSQALFASKYYLHPKNQSDFVPYLQLLLILVYDFFYDSSAVHAEVELWNKDKGTLHGDGVLSPVQILLPSKHAPEMQLWSGHLCHEIDPWPHMACCATGFLSLGTSRGGSISWLPLQSKSQKSKSLYLINKIPALFTAAKSQFTQRADRVFFQLKGSSELQ